MRRTRPSAARRRRARALTSAVLETFEARRLLSAAILAAEDPVPPAGTVSGTLFRDADGDGQRGPLEAALAGRTVYLDLDGNGAPDPTDPSTTTDAAGNYALPLPSTDPLVLRQVLPDGWEATGQASVSVTGGGDHPGVDFGSRETAATGGVTASVWRDANGDGRRDPGEAPIGGVGVYLDLNNNGARDADEPGALTSADTGVATIANVPAGSYAVRTQGVAGLVQTAPASNGPLAVTVGTGVADAGAFGFGAAVTGQISGLVFDDANGDGVRQATETSVLAGRVVYADLNNDGQLSAGEPSATSGAAGYRLDLAAGAYTVRQVVPSGWRQTAPANNAGASVVVTAYGTARRDFGTVRTTPPTASAGGPYSVSEGGTVTLAGTGSSPLGRPVTFEWDANYDGTRFDVEGSGAQPVFHAGTLDGPGSRTVALRVRDDLGNVSAISTATVQVVNAAPTAVFAGAGPVIAGKSTTVAFSGAADPSAADVAAGFKYSFDFNNDGTFEVAGSTAATATVPATYLATAGTRTVRGRITDKDGGWRDYTTTITVNPPPTNTPFSGTPIAIAATGTSTIPAENFDLGGEGVAWHDTDAANLGGDTAYRAGGVDLSTSTDGGAPAVVLSYVRAGEWLKYTVNVAQAGAYNVGFRVASLKAGGAMHLELDGARVTGSIAVPDTGGWANWRTLTQSYVSLPAGRHVLRLAFDSVGALGFAANVNALTVAPVPPLPGGYTGKPFRGTPARVFASGSSTIEAENFDDGGEGVAYHDTDAANLGGSTYRATGVDLQAITDGGAAGVGIGYTKSGEWVKYVVDVDADGTYDFDTRLASLTGGGNFHLDVDGTRVTPYEVVPKTGGWGVYTTVHQAGVGLKAGRHVLRLSFDANGSSGFVANFNWMRFTRR